MKIAIIILAVLVVALGGALYVNNNKYRALEAENNLNKQEMAANKQTVYTAIRDIRHGDSLIEGDNVQLENVYTGLPASVYLSKEELGSTAIVDIPAGVTVMSRMATPISIAKDTREYEIQVARLMQDQLTNDYVDIRIMFPDGRDMLVLPKKQIKNLDKEACVWWTYLNEEEILRLASATIDAYTITGTLIYATRYVETNLQDTGIPTYLVNTSVMDMFDPTSAYYDGNLLTKATQTLNADARLDMENKLRYMTDEKLSAVAAGHNLEDTAKNSALTGRGDYDATAAEEYEGTGATDYYDQKDMYANEGSADYDTEYSGDLGDNAADDAAAGDYAADNAIGN